MYDKKINYGLSFKCKILQELTGNEFYTCYNPIAYSRYQLSRTGSEGIREVRWVFPIQGIPESQPIKESYGAVIECQARDRLEERLEVTLAGVAPVTSRPMKSIYARSVTPKNESPKLPDGIVVGESRHQFHVTYLVYILHLLFFMPPKEDI